MIDSRVNNESAGPASDGLPAAIRCKHVTASEVSACYPLSAGEVFRTATESQFVIRKATSTRCELIIIIIRNLYSAIMPLGGYRGAGGTGR